MPPDDFRKALDEFAALEALPVDNRTAYIDMRHAELLWILKPGLIRYARAYLDAEAASSEIEAAIKSYTRFCHANRLPAVTLIDTAMGAALTAAKIKGAADAQAALDRAAVPAPQQAKAESNDDTQFRTHGELMKEAIVRLGARVRVLEDALRFYANPDSYVEHDSFGDRARDVLAGAPPPADGGT